MADKRAGKITCCPPVEGKKPCCLPSGRRTDVLPSVEVLGKLKLGYEKVNAENSKSLLRQCLTRDVFDKLKYRMTLQDSTLLDVVQSGYENLDSHVGVYASDHEAYTVFDLLFNSVIEKYHGFSATDNQPPVNWGDPGKFGDLDPTGQIIQSTRVRCGRSVSGFPFGPKMTAELYEQLETKVSGALSTLDGVHAGTYSSLKDMSSEDVEQLIQDHYLFKEGDRFLQAAKAVEFWPTGRGIYMNEDKTFLVWVGEEDHIRIISMQMGGNLGDVYKRLLEGAQKIEKSLPFVRNNRHGYLTLCPTNLGTTIRASVLIHLPKLGQDIQELEDLADKYNLQVRGSSGEHTTSPDGLYDVSNKRRLGLTEFDAVNEMYTGLQEIILAEKAKPEPEPPPVPETVEEVEEEGGEGEADANAENAETGEADANAETGEADANAETGEADANAETGEADANAANGDTPA